MLSAPHVGSARCVLCEHCDRHRTRSPSCGGPAAFFALWRVPPTLRSATRPGSRSMRTGRRVSARRSGTPSPTRPTAEQLETAELLETAKRLDTSEQALDATRQVVVVNESRRVVSTRGWESVLAK